MDRKQFFELVEREFFTAEEGRNIATKGYEAFDIESTGLVRVLKNTQTRNELFEFLVYEKEKDDWCFLSEEFAGFFMQALSANESVVGNALTIDKVEALYYGLLDAMMSLTAATKFDGPKVKMAYIGHMERLRQLLDEVMDLQELTTHFSE